MVALMKSSAEWWDNYFLRGGGWEKNGGRKQSAIFAKHFLKYADIDRGSNFSMLDAGCALGDAIAVFANHFPSATLYGIDFSEEAIQRASHEFGQIATFLHGGLQEIASKYDIIYCSNTLEHFSDFISISLHLTRLCRRLFIMVPYKEQKNGCDLKVNSEEHHQHTFYKDSFDFLIHGGHVKKISTKVFSCPGAWGWTAKQRVFEVMKNFVRPMAGTSWTREPRQILYDIITVS